jgi:hypothetical protein
VVSVVAAADGAFGVSGGHRDQLGVTRHELFELKAQQQVDIDAVHKLSVVVVLRRDVVDGRDAQKRTEILGETSRPNVIDIRHGAPRQTWK